MVWRTEERADTTRERRARERLLALDPQDVLAVPGEPRPKMPVATLRPMAGRPFHSPRFFADTSRLLVTHDDPLGDGAYRSDLYEWNYRDGALRRITHGASIRDADPLPDGKSAIGVRCENGLCDLVRVDLETGSVDDAATSDAVDAVLSAASLARRAVRRCRRCSTTAGGGSRRFRSTLRAADGDSAACSSSIRTTARTGTMPRFFPADGGSSACPMRAVCRTSR